MAASDARWERALRKKVRSAAALAARPQQALDGAQRQSLARRTALRAELVAIVGEAEAAREEAEGEKQGREADGRRQQQQQQQHAQRGSWEQRRASGGGSTAAAVAARRAIASAPTAEAVLRAVERSAGCAGKAGADTLIYALNAVAKRVAQVGAGGAGGAGSRPSASSCASPSASATAVATTLAAATAAEQLSPRQLTSALWSSATLAAALGWAPLRRPLRDLLAAAAGGARALDARGVATALWAVGKLTAEGGAGAASASAALLAALERRLEAVGGEFNARDVSSALWGLAKAHSRPAGAEARAAALRAARRCAGELQWLPQELSMTAWAVASLAGDWAALGDDGAVAAEAATALEEAMRSGAPRMAAPQALATCLWAVARARCGGARAVEGGDGDFNGGEGEGTPLAGREGALPASAAAAAAALHERAAERAGVGDFAARSLAMAAWAAAKLGRNARPLLAPALSHARSNQLLRGVSPADAADIAWAAAMDATAGSLRPSDEPWVGALVNAAAAAAAAADWQALGRLEFAAHALAKAECCPGDALSALRKATRGRAKAALAEAQSGASFGDEAAAAALEALAARDGDGWAAMAALARDGSKKKKGGAGCGAVVAGRHTDAAEARLRAAGGEGVIRWRPYAEGNESADAWPAPASKGDGYAAGVLRLPAARDAATMALTAMASVMCAGATLWCYGAASEGAGPMLTSAVDKALWKPLGSVVRAGGEGGDGHAGLAAAFRRRSGSKAAVAAEKQSADGWRGRVEMRLPRCGATSNDGAPAAAPWVTLPGLFAGGRADAMTRFLIANLPAKPPKAKGGAHVLDFGCGSGAVGAAIARAAEKSSRRVQVWALDACSAAAVAARSNVPGAKVVVSDGWAGLGAAGAAARSFEWLVSNPPVHNGAHTDFGVVKALLRGAPGWLAPGGALFMVTQCYVPAGLMARRWAKDAFAEVAIHASDGRFTVWRMVAKEDGSSNKSRKEKRRRADADGGKGKRQRKEKCS